MPAFAARSSATPSTATFFHSRQHVKLTQTGQVKGKRKLSGVEKAVKKIGEKSFASRIEDSVECYDCSEYDPPATGAAERAEGSGSGS